MESIQAPEIQIATGRDFPKKVIPLIRRATSSIDIIVYDWRWYPDEIGEACQLFNNSIVRAHQRGVVVRAVVNSILIKEILRRLNIQVMKLESNRTVHVKMMIIDQEIVILGSHNYSKTAFNINHEVSAIIHDRKVASDLTNYFESFVQE